ncbi:BamA/TamA family outer membrane protein [Acinetobacter radioresistens]|uniref:autotransporter assembly complex protein TamA n=1 Tax=Acinetobacter radioresistens TaxID=40216 RepID=UPI0020051689|nr:BamA/TamA family outer membrane protein [Acinetobacter radioresistens]MCK4086233.1 BamA/TamA family outer membrane protein [Acinetobacter radioresistens]MCK4106867.1 BamA/TamA family outer membrane protein [Acinetobacter radioresistens]
MPAKINFKQSALTRSIHRILKINHINKLVYTNVFLSIFTASVYAQEEPIPTYRPESKPVLTSRSEAKGQPEDDQDEIAAAPSMTEQELQKVVEEKKEEITQDRSVNQDSLRLLEQQTDQDTNSAFKPIEFEDLEEYPVEQIDQSMANEIYRVAEEAKSEAQAFRAGLNRAPETAIPEASQQELTAINQAPVNVDQLMQQIQSDRAIVAEINESGRTLAALDTGKTTPKDAEKPNIFKRVLYRIRPPRDMSTAETVPRITATVEGAPPELAANIRGKLSSFTQESFEDFNSALPQLRSLSNQAAQAVGYYNSTFRFEKVSDSRVRVYVQPNEPVRITEQDIEISGEGSEQPQFQVIELIPDQDVGDIFHHGLYEETKRRITDAASNNGYFDAYWRLHDVKISQPQNTAEINLRYETGDRYSLKKPVFQMSDPSKPFPLDDDILQSMVPWKEGDDYTSWRINTLANNLTNARYFNYTLVDAVKPDPIEKPLELPPDIQTLLDQQQISEQTLTQDQQRNKNTSAQEVTQNVVDEKQFAGTQPDIQQASLAREQQQIQDERETQQEQLREQARAERSIPVLITLNADSLNSVETGIGYGSDTGARLRTQYRRAIVNRRGHAFDSNLEVSKIRQALDGRYTIPYNHPTDDYINLVGGYEREEREDVGKGLNLDIESAVAGIDRIIKNPRGQWQHTFGARYRLDRLNQRGNIVSDSIPDAFQIPGSNPEQQSLLFGYETSRLDSDARVNPTRGFRQTYKVELGSKTLLSDADMALVNAGWRFIYSLGENNDHQFVGRADVGYIFTEDFDQVPYNIRYFTGGDQSIRGFDYKSLSPEEFGYKVGGQALATTSLEYNYQFKDGWRAAVFADAGNAYDKDFNTPTAYSAGLGIRWSSPVGPIRLDVAAGLSDDNIPIRLHFFIGPQL